jgi:hypothetical protein
MKVVLIAILGLLVASGTGVAATGNTLIATVQANGSFSLTRSHATVSKLRSGRYTIRVQDRSTRDGFHLKLVNGNVRGKQTGTKWTGTIVWHVTLTRGTYRYYSDTHRSAAKTFKVV